MPLRCPCNVLFFLLLLFLLQAYLSTLTPTLIKCLSKLQTTRCKISTFPPHCLRNNYIYLSKKLTMLGFFNSFITRISLMINSFFGCFCKLICLIATYDGNKLKKKIRTSLLILSENYKHQPDNDLLYCVSVTLYNETVIYWQVILLLPHCLWTILCNT